MEIEAIHIGLELHYFWSLTPKQFQNHIKAYYEREKNRIIEKDMLNHLLGKYITIAFNDPKNYPKKSFLSDGVTENKAMTDDDMEKIAKYNTIRMGGVVNDNR